MVVVVVFDSDGVSRQWQVLGGGVRGEQCRCDAPVGLRGRLGEGRVRMGMGVSGGRMHGDWFCIG